MYELLLQGTAEGIVGLLVFVVVLVFVIGIPIWVYSDAQKNSPHSAALWALVAFFGGLIGLVLYFIMGRKPHPPSGGY